MQNLHLSGIIISYADVKTQKKDDSSQALSSQPNHFLGFFFLQAVNK